MFLYLFVRDDSLESILCIDDREQIRAGSGESLEDGFEGERLGDGARPPPHGVTYRGPSVRKL